MYVFYEFHDSSDKYDDWNIHTNSFIHIWNNSLYEGGGGVRLRRTEYEILFLDVGSMFEFNAEKFLQ